MKTLLTILLSILSVTLMAQVPQGVGYQGVAADSEGIELVNQAISIRASILSGSVNGVVQWQEVHDTTTDDFGLFALTIGEGNNTGGGMLSSFADIPWGESTYFLQIEMDATGGMDYSLMGVNQMMSVPYALYAESTNLDYDSIANYLSGDSTFVTNISNGLGGGGCDYQFPEGLDGEVVSIDMTQGNYTVPNGKNLYILNTYCNSGWTTINLDGNNFIKYNDLQIGEGGNPMVGTGTTLSVYYSENPTHNMLYGLLVDKSVDFIAIDMLQSNYTVPNGKNLYILNAYSNSGNTVINLDGKNFIKYGDPSFGSISSEDISIVGSGSTLSVDSNSENPTYSMLYGYLADEDYFDDCGGQNNSESAGSGGNPNSLIYTIDGF